MPALRPYIIEPIWEQLAQNNQSQETARQQLSAVGPYLLTLADTQRIEQK